VALKGRTEKGRTEKRAVAIACEVQSSTGDIHTSGRHTNGPPVANKMLAWLHGESSIDHRAPGVIGSDSNAVCASGPQI